MSTARVKAQAKASDTFVQGSGNVYADLGLPNAKDLLARDQLVDAIAAVIEKRQLTQQKVAELTGVKQPKVSALLRGDTRGFTCDRLLRMLNALGQDVTIRVQPAKRRATVGHTHIFATV
ncbi:MAG: helix-turn-helix domain-containing protein [Vulcanimicrobiaceae bacterium]